MKKYILGILVTVAFSSCEHEKGTPVDTDLSSPFLSASSLAVTSVNLDDTSSNPHVARLPNGIYRITDTVIATVTSPLGPDAIRSVSYRLYAPGSSQYFTSGSLAKLGGSNYSGTLMFEVERSDVGSYVVEISAQDASSRVGNTSLLSLELTRNNARPVTHHLVAPDTLYRPASPSAYELIQFSITASDSDGYKDIQQVFFKRVLPPSATIISLYDDGDTQVSGDAIAGDGTFSRILRIDNTALLGDQTFLFQARDRKGALSDSLLHTITIR